VTQVVITYLFGIFSYVAAEYFDLSGVITVLICGVVLAHYNFYNLTVGGMHATAYACQQLESPSSRFPLSPRPSSSFTWACPPSTT
jgi:hypothetical protein